MGNRVLIVAVFFLVCLSASAEEAANQPANSTAAPVQEKPAQNTSSGTGNLSSKYIWMEPKMAVFEEKQKEGDNRPVKRVLLKTGIYERDLTIAWDEWRNRIAQAMLSRMFTNFGEALNTPSGLTSWYHCEISSDRKIKLSEISKSSGDLWYDHIVLNGVRRLDGDSILAFPDGSQRTEVSIDLGVSLGEPKSNYLNFNDMEYKEVDPEQPPEPEQSSTRTKKKR